MASRSGLLGVLSCAAAMLGGCFSTHPMEDQAVDPGTEPASPSPSSSDADPLAALDFDNTVPSRRTSDPPKQGVVVIGGPMQPPTDFGASPGSLAPVTFLEDMGDGWQALIEVDWQLAPGEETHICGRLTVPQDVYLHEFAPLVPLGTHHSVLSVSEPGQADGVEHCGVDLGGYHIYGSGVGSQPYALPDGVAMRVREGEQLNLNLHLFNVQAGPLSGRSGVWVRAIPQADVEQLAQITLGGTLQLQIPPGRVTQRGQCTMNSDSTIFSVGPHMHQLGVHMKVTAGSSIAGDVVIYDGPYAFESQQRHPVDFLQMRAGDVVQVECTYENTTDRVVGFGQSSLDEMCFASLIRYPAVEGGAFLCTD